MHLDRWVYLFTELRTYVNYVRTRSYKVFQFRVPVHIELCVPVYIEFPCELECLFGDQKYAKYILL